MIIMEIGQNNAWTIVNGRSIESTFNAKSLPGHYVELTVYPPAYSTAFEVDFPGILLLVFKSFSRILVIYI